MTYPEYYRARADEAQRKAMETSLPNVRTQYLKAAATWADMADRSERAERYRKEAPAPANPKVISSRMKSDDSECVVEAGGASFAQSTATNETEPRSRTGIESQVLA